MLGQQVLFTSRGTNPLKNWDVVCPRPSKLSEVSSSSGADAEVLSPGTISPAESRNNRAALTILNQRVSPKYVDQSASAAEKQGGCVEKVYDEEIRCFCFEIQGPGVSLVNPPQVKLAEKSKICPRPPTLSLGASQPHLLLLVKYIGEPFSVEFAVKDGQGISRRLRACTTTLYRAKNSQFSYSWALPPPECAERIAQRHSISVEEASRGCLRRGWNVISLDLDRLMTMSFNQKFVEVASITLHASMRVKVLTASDSPVPHDSESLLAALGLNYWPYGSMEPPLFLVPSRFDFTDYVTSNRSETPRPTTTNTDSATVSIFPDKDNSTSPVPPDKVTTPSIHHDLYRTPSTGECRGRSSAATTSSHPSSRLRSPVILSDSSLAALDLAEPLPPFYAEDIRNNEAFRPSLPSLPEEDTGRHLIPSSPLAGAGTGHMSFRLKSNDTYTTAKALLNAKLNLKHTKASTICERGINTHA